MAINPKGRVLGRKLSSQAWVRLVEFRELMLKFDTHVRCYYKNKNGRQASHVNIADKDRTS
ncbi:hypothetical protein KMU_30910 [Proteus vulgaris]|nr:hypothetical protein KMU_30910 [Proteus vulgaris]